MLIYLVIFFVSSYFFHLAAKCRSSLNTFGIVGVLLPSLLGAFRGIDVGTDTATYKYLYDLSQSVDLIVFEVKASVEPFYYYLSLLSAKLSGFSTLLLIYQLLCIVPIYLVGFKFKKKFPLWLVMLLYFSLIYSLTYNIMRQCACVSLLAYATMYLIEGKNKKYWIIALVGMIFHTSCIIGAVFIWIINYIRRLSPKRQSKVMLLYVSLLFLMCLLFLKIGSLLASIEVGRMEAYGNRYATETHSYISITELAYRSFFFVILWYVSYTKVASKKLTQPYFIILVTEIGLMTLGLYNAFLVRVAVYLTIFHLFFLPALVNSEKIKSVTRAKLNLLLATISVIYWLWTIAYRGSNAIVPYEFA